MRVKSLKFFADALILSVILLGTIYVLDDLIRVIHIKGTLEGAVLYGFFVGIPFAFAASVYGLIKWSETRFKLYTAMTSILMILGLALIYIVTHSQV